MRLNIINGKFWDKKCWSKSLLKLQDQSTKASIRFKVNLFKIGDSFSVADRADSESKIRWRKFQMKISMIFRTKSIKGLV